MVVGLNSDYLWKFNLVNFFAVKPTTSILLGVESAAEEAYTLATSSRFHWRSSSLLQV